MGLWRAWRQGQEARRIRRTVRAAARRLARAAPGGLAADPAGAFLRDLPRLEPGDPARGRALLAGRLLGLGAPVALPADLWTLAPMPAGLAATLHGHGWLDDLAALGGRAARARAQAWVEGWIARHGQGPGLGRGPGWAAATTGRRLRAWAAHGPWLLGGPGRAMSSRFLASAAAQAAVLAARGRAAPPGVPRFEALTGLALAALALRGLEEHLPGALAALDADCDGLIDAAGGLPGRNPEALLAVFTLLATLAAALRAADRAPGAALAAALARMAPTLKALRHADGGLARFHGGGAGAPGALDLALGEAGGRVRARADAAMGFVRLASRRTTVVVDAAPPPPGPEGHASTLAFEMTSGRRPVIVSAGPGGAFGPAWRRHGRATAAHATLTLIGLSSSRLGRAAWRAGPAAAEPGLAERPGQVTLVREGEGHAAELVLSHDGWVRSHGLVHIRRLGLAADGRMLMGEDALIATTPAARRRFADAAAREGGGVAFAIRFPLHPDVAAAFEPAGGSVTLRLRSGEVWQFRAEALVPVLEPAVHFDPARPAPSPCRVIVLSGRLRTPALQIGWTLAKAEDSPVGLRDVALDEETPG